MGTLGRMVGRRHHRHPGPSPLPALSLGEWLGKGRDNELEGRVKLKGKEMAYRRKEESIIHMLVVISWKEKVHKGMHRREGY